MNYEQEEDIDPPDINDPVQYDEPAPYDSNTEDSEENDACATAKDGRALIEPNFEAVPYEQDRSDNEGASDQDKNAPLSDEGDDDAPPFDKGDDEDEGISYNGNDNKTTDDTNDAGVSYDDSKEEDSTSSQYKR